MARQRPQAVVASSSKPTTPSVAADTPSSVPANIHSVPTYSPGPSDCPAVRDTRSCCADSGHGSIDDPPTSATRPVGRPVPAVRRFQDNLRALAPRGDLFGQCERIIVDAHGPAQPLALGRHPHDRTASPVQIYAHVLPAVIFVHKGPPSSKWTVTIHRKPPIGATVTRNGGPAPSSHQVPSGSSMSSDVPPPAGLAIVICPPSASTRSLRPVSPEP